MSDRLVQRFLSYVRVDTQSDGDSETFPSTIKQFDLARVVRDELMDLKLENVLLDENGYVTGTLPSNSPNCKDTIGFVAHFDTSPDFSGSDVNPVIHANYDGLDLVVNSDTIITVKEFPFLKNLVGDDLITSDGSTLLGADNKAGIAEIMELITRLQENPELPHGEIKVLFTPDEEVGRGTEKVNLENFKVDYAYTVDGGELGELEYENFNAASMQVEVFGRNIHPGTAKNKMKNAILIGMEFQSLLPHEQTPQNTEGYEGFFHLNDISGNVEHVSMFYIIRDHDRDIFEYKKNLALQAQAYMNVKYGSDTVQITIKDSYFNMKERIEPVMHIVDYAKRAMEMEGIVPLIKPIRGGTDGARLSFMGIPTPNIFTGGYNFHGRYEMISIQSMHKAVDCLVSLVGLIAKEEA
jgi:tripeptide aminopeptidase